MPEGHPRRRSLLHVVALAGQVDFDGWREAARRLALAGIEPANTVWHVRTDGQQTMLDRADALPPASPDSRLTVPREFIERVERAMCHSDPTRFALFYRLLWRLRHEPNLPRVASDTDVRRFEALEKAVARDIHKMRAFVRFRRIEDDGAERYIAWFEPEHFIVERNAPFFARRFTGMVWSILTPKGSVAWDGEALSFGPPASRQDAPAEDAAEELWRTYYRNIFNPARLMVDAMQKEMPKKYWRNLPEASLIPDLIAGADKAATDMIARMPTAPAPHHDKIQARHWPTRKDEAALDDLPEDATLEEVREAAKSCRRCPLWRDATQTVFGEGPRTASVLFVGEQPGDQEDLAGKPFVGPAGKVFDAILDDAGIDRLKTYVTNAVKHFKFIPRGKIRLHQKPSTPEIRACRQWYERELAAIKPDLVVAMGATAAQCVLGKITPINKNRGKPITLDHTVQVLVTVHPSYLLRLPDEEAKAREYRRFVDDLRLAAKLLKNSAQAA